MAKVALVTEDQKRRMASFKSWHERGLSLLKEAIGSDEVAADGLQKRETIKLYEKAVSAFDSGLRAVPNAVPVGERADVQHRRQVMQNHRDSAIDRISQIRKELCAAKTNENGEVRSLSNSESSASFSGTTKKTGGLFTSKEEQEIKNCIIIKTNVTMDDIKGNEAAKQALEETVILPALNPSLFTGLRTPTKGILLFGPPGNGKTMLAKAVANEAGATFFNISAATIMSKWVGQGEKMMKQLFDCARAKQPSIIFIDEVDSMLCARSDDESGGASRRVITEFLLQFDGVTSDHSDRVLVLGATNRPFDLDDGVLRRFPRRISVDLPNSEARQHLILHSFKSTNINHSILGWQLKNIGEKTEGYSYSDLAALCREAAMEPLRSIPRAKLKNAQPKDIRPVTAEDLVKAMEVIKPSTTPNTIHRLNHFAREYAQVK
jgi:spastin